MSNQTLLIFFFPTFTDLLPDLIFAYVFFMVFGFVALLSYAKKRQGDERAAMEPLCVWQYSAEEWQKYAADYDLAKFPKGAARVQITLLDVWIIDDRVRRLILDDVRKCVTACKFEKQILKIRIRSWAVPTRFGSVNYSVENVFLPVPFGMERDVIETTKLFNKNIARQSKKVASVMPNDSFNGLLGEANF